MNPRSDYKIEDFIKILEELTINETELSETELSSIEEEITEILEALKELNFDNEIALELINRLEKIIL